MPTQKSFFRAGRKLTRVKSSAKNAVRLCRRVPGIGTLAFSPVGLPIRHGAFAGRGPENLLPDFRRMSTGISDAGKLHAIPHLSGNAA
jgi:hypothetical protein